MRRSLPYSLILVPVFSGLILYQILYTPSPDELLAPTYDSGVGSSVDYIFNNMAAIFTVTSISLYFTAFIILLILESLFLNLSKRWLVLPILYFGFFYTMLIYEFTVKSTIESSGEYQNRQNRLVLDWSRVRLVTKGIQHWFLVNYDLPVTFEETALGRDGYLAHRIVPIEQCDDIRDRNLHKIIEGLFLRQLYQDGAKSEDYCLVSNSEKPQGRTIHVSREVNPIRNIFVNLKKIDFIIRDWGDNEYRIFAGTSPTLFPFPIPLVNCMPQEPQEPQEPQPSWLGCRFEFARFQGDPFETRFETEEPQWRILADHLQLEPVSIHDREIADTRRLMQEMHMVAGAILVNEFSKLSEAIINPDKSIDDPDLRILTASPEFIALGAERFSLGILRNLEHHRSGKGNSSKNIQILSQVLAHTPTEKLAERGALILALYEDADENDLIWQQTALLGAIGAIGESALPVILRAPEESWRQDQAKIAGICRVGHAALPEAEAFLSRMWEQDHAGDGVLTINVLYAAIRRTGMAVPEFHSRIERHERRLTRRFGDITPESDISICDGALRH
ncbi:MAG: putative membrane protein [Saliniramus fredricksonii]|uniref:Putative membrane protein n=2 Tax=Saliniramus fredricksonii TaxID=1653334 RepID=A0A0P7ZVJ1_9HYPH|nr:MAG: putative membrane protein [Saliniramus fredricksonii]SCC81680.1 hypothetical protein GA0071312_2639 [Saliniramus fredricksonii]